MVIVEKRNGKVSVRTMPGKPPSGLFVDFDARTVDTVRSGNGGATKVAKRSKRKPGKRKAR